MFVDAAKLCLVRGHGGALEVKDDEAGAGGALVDSTDEAVLEDVVAGGGVVAAVGVVGDGRAVVHGGGDTDAGTVCGPRGTLSHAKEVCSIPQKDRRGRRSQCGVHKRERKLVGEPVSETNGWQPAWPRTYRVGRSAATGYRCIDVESRW